MEGNEETPLILVFYMGMDTDPNVREFFIDAIKQEIHGRNILGLFLPTNGDERVECINPVIINDIEKLKEIDKLILDIKNKFQIE